MAYWYYKTSPIKVKDGYQVKNKRGKFGQKWFTRIWVDNLERSSDSARMGRARTYLRKGQVSLINIKLGEVVAEVQGSRSSTYKVNIKFKNISKSKYVRLIGAIKERSEVVFELIKGQISYSFRDVIEEFQLIPGSLSNLDYSCSCPDYGRPCKHVGSIIYAISELMDEDPMLLFVLRNINKENLISDLKEKYYKKIKASKKKNKNIRTEIDKIEKIMAGEIQLSKIEVNDVIQCFNYTQLSKESLSEIKSNNNLLKSLNNKFPSTWIGNMKKEMKDANLFITEFLSDRISYFDNLDNILRYLDPKYPKFLTHKNHSDSFNLNKSLNNLIQAKVMKKGPTLLQLQGLGKKSIDKFRKYGIETIEDLTNLSYKKFKKLEEDFNIKQLEKYKSQAYDLLLHDEEKFARNRKLYEKLSEKSYEELQKLKGVGLSKSKKLYHNGIFSIRDLANLPDEFLSNDYISKTTMISLKSRAIRYLSENETTEDISLLTIHGFWVPFSEHQSPGLFLWFEDPMKSVKQIVNSDFKKKNQIYNPDRLQEHPTSISLLKLQETIATGGNYRLIEFFNNYFSKEEMVNLYLPTITNNVPINSFVSRIHQNYFWSTKEENLRRIITKLDEYYSNINPNYFSELNLVPWTVNGIQLNSFQSLKFLETIKIETEKKNYHIADDLKYWLDAFSVVHKNLIANNIVPSLLSQNEFRDKFHSNPTRLKNDKLFVAWWQIHNSDTYINDLKYLTDKIPYSSKIVKQKLNSKNNVIKSPNKLRPKVIYLDSDHVNSSSNLYMDKEPVIDDGVKIQFTPMISTDQIFHNHKIIDNFMQIMSNTLVKSLNVMKIVNKSPPIGYKVKNDQIDKIVKGLFTDDPKIIDDNYWFYNEYKNWMANEENTDQWTLSLQLIPPDIEFENQWFLSFYLKNLTHPHIILPITEIMKTPSKPIAIGNIVIEKPLEIFLRKLNEISHLDILFQKIIDESTFSYYKLNNQELEELLGGLGQKLKIHNYDVLLPKSILKNFSPKINNQLQINLKTKAKLGGDEILQFDLKLMIGDSKISIREIEKMAKERKSLVNLAGKWIHFDFEKAIKIRDILMENISGMNNLDVIKFEMGDHSIIDEQSSELNLFIKSDLKKLTKYELSKTALKKIGYFEGNLRKYQKKGVEWFVNLALMGMGGIMADDMGLGKTIQALAGIQYLKNNRKLSAPVLIVAPTSVLGNWANESKKFTPKLKIYLHHGSDRIRNKTPFIKKMRSFDIIISSYALMRIDEKIFSEIKWSGIILDEAQNIKNPNTKQSKTINKLKGSFKFALTGTPIENRLSDLWSIFNFTLPHYLGNLKNFKENYIKPIELDNNALVLQKLRKISHPFIIRRSKNDKAIINDLPEKIETLVYTSLSKEQLAFYTATVETSLLTLKSLEGMKRRGVILSTLTKLKQICNHLGTFIDEKKYKNERSGKLDNLIIRLGSIIENGEKAIIFTQYVAMGKILQKEITPILGYEPFYLYGATPRKKREVMINKFNEDILSNQILIISLKAGGTGLNLTGATHVFHYDRWWNPAVEDQATDRAYRIGQKKTVFVYKYITQGTIETKIDEIITEKRQLANQFISGLPKQLTELNNDELQELFTLHD